MMIMLETVEEMVTYAKNITEKGSYILFEFPYEEEIAHVRIKNNLSWVEVKCNSMSGDLEKGFEQEIKEKLSRLA